MKKTTKGMILLCTLLLCGCGRASAEQLELRKDGISKLQNMEYEAAVETFDEALLQSDLSVGEVELDIAAYKASALYHAGRFTEAKETCDAILDMKKNADIFVMRGLLQKEAGELEAAKADFEEAKKMTSSKDNVMLGRISYYMEDYTSAKEYLESAYESGETEARFWEAELYWQMGNEDYAVTLYQSYLAGEPRQQAAYQKVAAFQLKQEDYDAALETIQKGIQMGNAGCLQQLLAQEIAVYEQKREFATAKEKMESYVNAYPEDEEAAREYEFLKNL